MCFSRLTGAQFADWIGCRINFQQCRSWPRVLFVQSRWVYHFWLHQNYLFVSVAWPVSFSSFCLVLKYRPAFVCCVPNFVGIPSSTDFSLNYYFYYIYYYFLVLLLLLISGQLSSPGPVPRDHRISCPPHHLERTDKELFTG